MCFGSVVDVFLTPPHRFARFDRVHGVRGRKPGFVKFGYNDKCGRDATVIMHRGLVIENRPAHVFSAPSAKRPSSAVWSASAFYDVLKPSRHRALSSSRNAEPFRAPLSLFNIDWESSQPEHLLGREQEDGLVGDAAEECLVGEGRAYSTTSSRGTADAETVANGVAKNTTLFL